jgi:transketolase
MPDTPAADVDLAELAQQLRVDSVRAAAAAGSGHPTSSMSAADLVAVLVARHLRYDFDDPDNPNNDHLIFSKGHASPLVYSMFKAAGAVTDDDLLSFRRFGSRLEGHPSPVLPWVDVATGSLGQGLPIGTGIALTGKLLDRLPYRVWVICGDSEMAEGSMWEAFEQAGFRKLDNLCAIVDVNRLGQRGPTMHQWDLESYAARARANGWHAITVDGHDHDAIDAALAEVRATDGKPTAVIARTRKGEGVAAVADQENWHGKPLAEADEAVAELGGRRDLRVAVARPDTDAKPNTFDAPGAAYPTYEVGGKVATRKAYGEALAALGSNDASVIALDGEVANSTYSEIFQQAHPDRFIEAYIAEQQMVADAVGAQVRGWYPFVSTFAAFLTRAADFVRMAAVSRARLSLCGSHAGVSIGEDGPSQMGLEDLAMMRAVHGSTVLYPCDGNQTARLVAALADVTGISYLRTTRADTPVIYGPDDAFEIGGSRVVRQSDGDVATVVAAGITLHEALEAADALAAEGTPIRVVDAYSIKPIDTDGLHQAAAATDNRLVTVEDHWAEGGLGDAVLSAFVGDTHPPTVVKLAVTEMPSSGKPDELLAAAGIDAEAIAEAVRGLASPSKGAS